MNALNRATSAVFDVLLLPLEALGAELALILASGIFGILALIIFKHISWQKGIKAAKDKIKAHMIAIRIYQDDLAIVGKSVLKVFLRNFQYLGLNFGPILPLFVPFLLVAAQLVVRYGFAPLPVVDEARVAALLPGEGTLIEVELKPGREAEVLDLELRLPPFLRPISPLVRHAGEGRAFQEVVAIASGRAEIEVFVGGASAGKKDVVAGSEGVRKLQPERVSSFWAAWLWPAEDTLPASSPLSQVKFEYPDRDLALLPEGAFGVILVFFLSSIAFGVLVLKPLHIQI